jgi:hypothetical protein
MAGETKVLGEKPHRPPQIPHGTAWYQTQTAVMGGRRLAASDMVRPNVGLIQEEIVKYFTSIVKDLMNVLPGNSSVNTVPHATNEVTVFSLSAVTSRSGGWRSRDMCFL